MTDDGRNGHGPVDDGNEVDEGDEVDDTPLDEAEAAAGAAAAGQDTDESLDERVGAVCEELGDVTHAAEGDTDRLSTAGRLFAIVGADTLEVALEGAVAKAALATPDTSPSPRGPGWVAFTPEATDRFALDRAEAWVRFAHRRAATRGTAH